LSHKHLPTLRVLTFYAQHFNSFILRGILRGSSSRKISKLVRIIVSQTISYIVTFNFLRQAVQTWGEPFDVGSPKKYKQPSEVN